MKNETKQITQNVEIITNGQKWAARKIDGGNVINSNSWVSKTLATKRAKFLQKDIDDGFIKA